MKVSGFGIPRWRSAAGISQNVATAPFNLGGRPRYHDYQQHEHAITILFSLDIITMLILIEHKWHPMEMTLYFPPPGCVGLRSTCARLLSGWTNTKNWQHNTDQAQHRPSTTQHNTDQVLNTKDVPGQALPMLCTSSPGFGDLSQGFFLFW